MLRFALISLFIPVAALAGESRGSLYIVKTNGDTVFGESKVVEQVFAPDLLIINGDSLHVTEVSTVKNGLGYFRHPQAGFGNEQLAMRTFDGKLIDKYTIEQSGFSGPPGQMMMTNYQVGLYSKNEGPLKEVDYDNVKADFWDNAGSRPMIETYEQKRRLQWWALAGGLVAIIAAAPLNGDYPAVGAPLGVAGTIGLGMAIYEAITKGKYVYKAVDNYVE